MRRTNRIESNLTPPALHPALAASRGLSARHWKDVRQAARIASSEDVKIELPSGVTVSSTRPAALQQRENRPAPRHEERRPTPPTSVEGNKASATSKKQLRDDARARDKRAQPSVAKFQLFASRLRTRARITLLNLTRISFRLEEEQTRSARLRLRAVFFKLYTSPNAACLASARRVDQCDGGYGLATCSPRDACTSTTCRSPLSAICPYKGGAAGR